MRQQDPDEAIRARAQESARPRGGQLGNQVAEQAATQEQNSSDPDADDDAWVGVHEQPTLTGIDVEGNRVDPRQAPLALIVDDNRMNRDLCAVHLTVMGCRVLAAENGLEGWRIARMSRPDIIILDISMPVMDGQRAGPAHPRRRSSCEGASDRYHRVRFGLAGSSPRVRLHERARETNRVPGFRAGAGALREARKRLGSWVSREVRSS
jgi:CheY-like chemotaxis protein